MVHVVLMALCLLATDPAACGLGALGSDIEMLKQAEQCCRSGI